MHALKLSTEYSFGSVYAPLDELMQDLKAKNITSACICDNDTWGHVPFFNACIKNGIKPILGVLCTVNDLDNDRTPKMQFIAKNEKGLKELYYFLTKSYKQKLAYKYGYVNRLFTSDVLNMSDNIIKIAHEIIDGDFLKKCNAYIDIIEGGSDFRNNFKKTIASNYNLKLFNTSINTVLNQDDVKQAQYLKGFKQSLTPLIVKGFNCDVTNEIVNSIELEKLPQAPTIHFKGDLKTLVYSLIPSRFKSLNKEFNESYKERLEYELNIIELKNFSSYFLAVYDLVNYAKKHMLVGFGRGSSAGSLVCYILGITEVDPLENGLIFERFIDITRSDLPDIDIDFPDQKREQVIEYIKSSWGSDNVAILGNVAFYKPKSVLIDVCKKHNLSPLLTAPFKDEIIVRSPSDPLFKHCLRDTFLSVESAKEFIKNHSEVMDGCKLEGHAVRSGVHASAVLICNEPLYNYCVVDDKGIAHIDKNTIEQINILKMDVLGLRTLTVLENSVPKGFDFYNIPLNDPKALEVFNTKRFSGIFQFEGNTMRDLASKVTFHNIHDIDAVTALGRPATLQSGIAYKWLERKDGSEFTKISNLSYELLKNTFELPIYQEDTMRIVSVIGGFSIEDTNKVRKLICKSQGSTAILAFKDKFLSNASEKIGYDASLQIWDLISSMGSYQMNKAHTFSYSMLSYLCAYLKAHYPLQFLASSLTHSKDNESAVTLLKEMIKEGYEYKYFDPALSEIGWTVKDNLLIGGFTSLDGVGLEKAKYFIHLRENNLLNEDFGKYTSVFKNVFEISTKYQDYYNGLIPVQGGVYYINNIPSEPQNKSSYCFIGKVEKLLKRDELEQIRIEQRQGKPFKGLNTTFYDLTLKDDTSSIKCRVSAFIYPQLKIFLDKLEVGQNVLVRAKFFNNIKFAFIEKIRIL